MTAPSSYDRNILISRLTESHQWDRLLDAAREWLAEEPENPRAHRYAAQALVNLKRHREAEDHLTKALAANPRDPFAHRLMAIVQFDLKKYREADKSIHEAIELYPLDAMNWYQLAWMCYQQKDLKNGLKWITKARELDPQNPDILNLHAMCAGMTESPTLLEEVLALDPEHAPAHNNLGVYYLNQKNYAKAEECFRRALTLDPDLKVARRNLFVAIKHRDLIYRILRAPLDLLISFRNALLGGRGQKRNMGAALAGFIVWFFVVRFFIIGVAFWFGLVWPMLKFYEFLVIGDLRKKAGEVGATRGGILGYRRWSLHVRLTLLCTVLVAFWTAVYFLVWSPTENSAAAEQRRLVVITVILGAGLTGLGGYYLVLLFKRSTSRYHAWKRERALRKLEET